MAIWGPTVIQVHENVPHHILSPSISITASINSISRTESRISADIFASLNAMSGGGYFGYPLGVAASIDGGPVIKILDKPAEPNVWPDGYGANTVTCTSTNTTTDVYLHIWFYADCTCPGTSEVPSIVIDGVRYYEVYSYLIESVAPPMTYTVTVKANGGQFVIGSQTTSADQTLTKTHDEPLTINYIIKRTGYKLLGLAESATATSGTAMPITYTGNADKTYYAVWKRNSFIHVKQGDSWVAKDPIIWQMHNGSWRKVEPYYVCKTIDGRKGWCRSDDLTTLVYDENGNKIL